MHKTIDIHSKVKDYNDIRYKCPHCNQFNELPVTQYCDDVCVHCGNKVCIYEPVEMYKIAVKMDTISMNYLTPIGTYTIDQLS